MLDFVNADIKAMNERQFLNMLHEYSHVMTAVILESKPQFLEFAEKYEQCVGRLSIRTSADALQERKMFFTEIQSHIRSRIKAIMEAVESGENREMFKMPGKRSLVIVPFFDCFIENFSAEKRKATKELEREKLEVDLWLAEIISCLSLKPKRFRQCVRCSKIFIHTTSHKKKYCSTNCAGAARQTRYLERKISRKKENLKE